MHKLFLLGFCLITGISLAQKDECLKEFDGGYCLVKVNDDYGIKKKNKFIVPAFFDTLIPIGREHFFAMQNGRKGVFDKKGRMVVPVNYMDVLTIDAQKDLFEVFATGIRCIYITPQLDKLFKYRKVGETTLASATETTVIDYLAMVQYASDNEECGIDWKKMIPDTNRMNPKTRTVIRYFLTSEDELSRSFEYYGWHGKGKSADVYFNSSFHDDRSTEDAIKYPVTGITYEQAVMYCKVKSYFYNKEINPYADEKLAIRFRLPKLFEWEDIAVSGLPDEKMKTAKSMDSINTKGCPLFLFRYSFDCESVQNMEKKRGKGLVLSDDFFPNASGLYNLFGNVAEMIDEKGYAKGGSYWHYAAQCSINNNISYTEAQPWLGFRSIGEIYVTE